MTNIQNIHPWRVFYWEPVADTGERLMVGVVYQFSGSYKFTRTIRDDVLIGLFGKHHQGITKLITHNLEIYANLAQAANSIEILSMPIGGLHPGPMRVTEAFSSTDILQTACLLYSSLGNLDKFDELDESDAPQQEEVNKRFGSELKTVVVQTRPDLAKWFGKSSLIIQNGVPVKFGFLSEGTALHFTVIHPVRQSSSVRDARARIFELQRAKEYADLQIAALIAAVPRADDATLGSRQRAQLLENQKEMEDEAGAVNLTWISVNTAQQGAERLIELVS